MASAQLQTVGVWIRPEELEGREYDPDAEDGREYDNASFQRGVIYYLHPNTGQLLGVVLWNAPNTRRKLQQAKKMIQRKRAFTNIKMLKSQIEFEPQEELEELAREAEQAHAEKEAEGTEAANSQ